MNYQKLIIVSLVIQSAARALQASQDVATRDRAYSGRRLSSFIGNKDFGTFTQEEQEIVDKRISAQKALDASFFKAAQTGQGLEHFLALDDFDFNMKNELDGGKTALMYVAQLGLTELAKKLMEKKAWAFTVKDHAGRCAYDHAEGNGDVRKLMQALQFQDLCRRNSIKKMMTDVCTVLYNGVEIIEPQEENKAKE